MNSLQSQRIELLTGGILLLIAASGLTAYWGANVPINQTSASSSNASLPALWRDTLDARDRAGGAAE